MDNKNYTAPQTVELGNLIQLTKGSSNSPIWDMGSGLKPPANGGGTGPFIDNQG